jgi:hypothetical protein
MSFVDSRSNVGGSGHYHPHHHQQHSFVSGRSDATTGTLFVHSGSGNKDVNDVDVDDDPVETYLRTHANTSSSSSSTTSFAAEESRNVALIRYFAIEQFSSFKRYVLRTQFFPIENASPGYVDALVWLLAWAFTLSFFLFCTLWVLMWGATSGRTAFAAWGINFVLVFVQEIVLSELAKPVILQLVAMYAIEPQLLAIYRVLYRKALRFLERDIEMRSTSSSRNTHHHNNNKNKNNKSKNSSHRNARARRTNAVRSRRTSSSSSSSLVTHEALYLVQHVSPACRAAHASVLYALPVARILRQISGADLEVCSVMDHKPLHWLVLYFVGVPVLVGLFGREIAAAMLSAILPTSIDMFILANFYLVEVSAFALLGVYLGLSLFYWYRHRVARPAMRQLTRDMLHLPPHPHHLLHRRPTRSRSENDTSDRRTTMTMTMMMQMKMEMEKKKQRQRHRASLLRTGQSNNHNNNDINDIDVDAIKHRHALFVQSMGDPWSGELRWFAEKKLVRDGCIAPESTDPHQQQQLHQHQYHYQPTGWNPASMQPFFHTHTSLRDDAPSSSSSSRMNRHHDDDNNNNNNNNNHTNHATTTVINTGKEQDEEDHDSDAGGKETTTKTKKTCSMPSVGLVASTLVLMHGLVRVVKGLEWWLRSWPVAAYCWFRRNAVRTKWHASVWNAVNIPTVLQGYDLATTTTTKKTMKIMAMTMNHDRAAINDDNDGEKKKMDHGEDGDDDRDEEEVRGASMATRLVPVRYASHLLAIRAQPAHATTMTMVTHEHHHTNATSIKLLPGEVEDVRHSLWSQHVSTASSSTSSSSSASSSTLHPVSGVPPMDSRVSTTASASASRGPIDRRHHLDASVIGGEGGDGEGNERAEKREGGEEKGGKRWKTTRTHVDARRRWATLLGLQVIYHVKRHPRRVADECDAKAGEGIDEGIDEQHGRGAGGGVDIVVDVVVKDRPSEMEERKNDDASSPPTMIGAVDRPPHSEPRPIGDGGAAFLRTTTTNPNEEEPEYPPLERRPRPPQPESSSSSSSLEQLKASVMRMETEKLDFSFDDDNDDGDDDGDDDRTPNVVERNHHHHHRPTSHDVDEKPHNDDAHADAIEAPLSVDVPASTVPRRRRLTRLERFTLLHQRTTSLQDAIARVFSAYYGHHPTNSTNTMTTNTIVSVGAGGTWYYRRRRISWRASIGLVRHVLALYSVASDGDGDGGTIQTFSARAIEEIVRDYRRDHLRSDRRPSMHAHHHHQHHQHHNIHTERDDDVDNDDDDEGDGILLERVEHWLLTHAAQLLHSLHHQHHYNNNTSNVIVT